jgi:hypothetical protein
MFKHWLALSVISTVAVFGDTLEFPYSSMYTIVDLGSVPGTQTPYGGLAFEAGNANSMLVGGDAGQNDGVVDSIGIVRNVAGHIIGFTGTAAWITDVPDIGGGLAYAPNGDLLFTENPTNQIGELIQGDWVLDRTVTAPVTSSVGTLAFIPAGYAGAGSLVIASYDGGTFCTSALAPDGSGTYDISGCSNQVITGGDPVGMAWVMSGAPGFSAPTVLVSLSGSQAVYAYTINANGLPDPATAQEFISGITGLEGGVIDPLTGDFLFSVYDGETVNIFEVQGFTSSTPEPFPCGLVAAAILAGMLWRRRLRSHASPATSA